MAEQATATGIAPESAKGANAKVLARRAALINAQRTSGYSAITEVSGTYDETTRTYTMTYVVRESSPRNSQTETITVNPSSPSKPFTGAFTIPDKILPVTQEQLKNSTQETIVSELKKAYDKYVVQIENQAAGFRNNTEDISGVNAAFSEAMQQLGQKYNNEYESIREFYMGLRNGNGSEDESNNGANDKKAQENRISVKGVPNRTKELRWSPGYTNYVVSTGKNVNGVIADSSFYKRYYSDISAELYINGEWFQDINSISWQISRQQYPLFGYNSYIFDDLALGTRIIQGQFVVNFTEPDIMKEVIAKGTRSGSTVGNGTTFEEFSSAAHSHTVTIDGQGATYKSNPVRNAIWRPRFDIDIMFGEKEQLDGKEYLPRHIILWDCNLSSSGIGTSANGGVLMEQYTFIARDFRVIS